MSTPRTRPWLLIAACVAATTALAHSGVKNQGVMDRMNAMVSSKKAVETLVAMIEGKTAFDADVAATARAALIANTKATPELFREPHSDPKSEALPVIWTDWAGFEAKNADALRAAEALDTATLPGLHQSLVALGAKCLACHETYRKMPKE